MPRILYTGAVVMNYEDFPQGCQRSRPGALHLSNLAAIDVTDDELACLTADQVPFEVLEAPQPEPSTPLVRAHEEDGTFKPDDPATPDVNEAWTPAGPKPKKSKKSGKKA